MRTFPVFSVFSFLIPFARSLQWCDKNYLSTDPIVPPDGQFPFPLTSSSSTPLLALRCAPVFKPYLASDAPYPVAFIIDAPLTNINISNAKPITLSTNSSAQLSVTIKIGTNTLAQGSVPLNASRSELPFSLSGLTPSTTPYNVTCTASYSGSQTFTATSTLTYLPNPTSGSATKMDLRTGALLSRRPNGSGNYEPVFPIGFYTQFNYYLASNLSMLDELAREGFTMVHPIPPYDDPAAFRAVVDRMEQVGLYLMYDMRLSYQNLSAVRSQTNDYHSSPALLLWYTTDEPDGSGDPPSFTIDAYNAISAIDSYHPTSLVLNCQNYNFHLYVPGADIILQDAYVVGVNATYSNHWGTPCTPDYGVCGCDNCRGRFEDITDRMDQYLERLFIMGYDRTKTVWGVPQAFIQEEYWSRYPTGREFILQSVIAINHGATGIVSWKDPTTAEIKANASILAKSLPSMTPYILNANATRSVYYNPSTRIDAGIWRIPAPASGGNAKALILASNLNDFNATLDLQSVPGVQNAIVPGSIRQVLSGSGGILDSAGRFIQFDPTGSAAFTFDLKLGTQTNSTTQSSGAILASSTNANLGVGLACLIAIALLFGGYAV